MLFVIVVLGGLIFHGWKIFHTPPQKKIVETEILCRFNNISPDLLATIKVGDREVIDGEIQAEIKEILLVEPFYYTAETEDGKLVSLKHPKNKQVWVKLRIKGDLKYNTLFYHNELICPTAPLVFKADSYTLEGFIQEKVPPVLSAATEKIIDTPQRDKVSIDFYIIFFNIPSRVIDSIEVGDSRLGKNGHICASIKNIHTKANQIDIREYPHGDMPPQTYKLPAILTLECDVINNTIYFEGKEVRPGVDFIFKTKKYTLYGIVINNLLVE